MSDEQTTLGDRVEAALRGAAQQAMRNGNMGQIDAYRVNHVISLVEREIANLSEPVPMFLTCPHCRSRHIDEGESATKPHHTHACQECGLAWRPAIVATVGVRFLPGFKNAD